jgi:hypothetical protein
MHARCRLCRRSSPESSPLCDNTSVSIQQNLANVSNDPRVPGGKYSPPRARSDQSESTGDWTSVSLGADCASSCRRRATRGSERRALVWGFPSAHSSICGRSLRCRRSIVIQCFGELLGFFRSHTVYPLPFHDVLRPTLSVRLKNLLEHLAPVRPAHGAKVLI